MVREFLKKRNEEIEMEEEKEIEKEEVIKMWKEEKEKENDEINHEIFLNYFKERKKVHQVMDILNEEMEKETNEIEEIEEVERRVKTVINITKRLLGRRRKEKRNEMSHREKMIERMKEAIKKEDFISLKKLGVKGKKKQMMKRAKRKLKKLQLQQEIETGQNEMMNEEWKRISSNSIKLRFGRKKRRRNEDEEVPD